MLILQQYFVWCGQTQVTVLQRRILYWIKIIKTKPADSVAHASNFVAHATNFVAHASNFVAHATNFVAHATDFVARATDFVARSTDFVACATDFVAHATDFVACGMLITTPVVKLIYENIKQKFALNLV